MSTLLWTVAGATAGSTHSLALRHSAGSANPWMPLIGLLRLALVAGVLTTAAISGFLFSAFAGWVTAYAATLLVLFQRGQ